MEHFIINVESKSKHVVSFCECGDIFAGVNLQESIKMIKKHIDDKTREVEFIGLVGGNVAVKRKSTRAVIAEIYPDDSVYLNHHSANLKCIREIVDYMENRKSAELSRQGKEA